MCQHSFTDTSENSFYTGVVLFDRVRHADVLHYLWWINSFAPKVSCVLVDLLYQHREVFHSFCYPLPQVYSHLHGDKDTFSGAFALAFKAHEFRQIDTPPGACLLSLSVRAPLDIVDHLLAHRALLILWLKLLTPHPLAGGVFHWGEGMLEHKSVPEESGSRYSDGWQLVGAWFTLHTEEAKQG